MIAISEHLRNHGFDPDVETHTRIPHIWAKLRLFYNMDAIDERDSAFDYYAPGSGNHDGAAAEEEPPENKYKYFELPPNEFHDLMWARAAAGPGEESAPPSDAGADTPIEKPAAGTRKRKRGTRGGGDAAADAASVAGSATTKTRASTVDDTDQETPIPSSPAGRTTARGARSQRRAVAKAKAVSTEPEVEEGGEDEEEEAEDHDDDNGEEDSDEESEKEEPETVPATRSGRGGGGRGRGRGRGRGKAGRKKG